MAVTLRMCQRRIADLQGGRTAAVRPDAWIERADPDLRSHLPLLSVFPHAPCAFPRLQLQGTGTCRDVHAFLVGQGKLSDFPLFTTVYEIADCGKDPQSIVSIFMSTVPRTINKSRTPLAKL